MVCVDLQAVGPCQVPPACCTPQQAQQQVREVHAGCAVVACKVNWTVFMSDKGTRFVI
jgi:hypothetical protein